MSMEDLNKQRAEHGRIERSQVQLWRLYRAQKSEEEKAAYFEKVAGEDEVDSHFVKIEQFVEKLISYNRSRKKPTTALEEVLSSVKAINAFWVVAKLTVQRVRMQRAKQDELCRPAYEELQNKKSEIQDLKLQLSKKEEELSTLRKTVETQKKEIEYYDKGRN